jgi:hypothetical protein
MERFMQGTTPRRSRSFAVQLCRASRTLRARREADRRRQVALERQRGEPGRERDGRALEPDDAERLADAIAALGRAPASTYEG